MLSGQPTPLPDQLAAPLPDQPTAPLPDQPAAPLPDQPAAPLPNQLALLPAPSQELQITADLSLASVKSVTQSCSTKNIATSLEKSYPDPAFTKRKSEKREYLEVTQQDTQLIAGVEYPVRALFL